MGLLSRAAGKGDSTADSKKNAEEAGSSAETVTGEIDFDDVETLTEIETAETNEPHKTTLDAMGKALRERLLRLPLNENTPYTVLRLLKIYGVFHAGACLALQDGVYSGYASTGLGTEKIAIPREKIWSKEKEQKKYFKVDHPETLDIKTSGEKFMYWVFPLDNFPKQNGSNTQKAEGPWKNIMLLGVPDPMEGTTAFDPEPLSIVLEDVTEKIIPQEKQDTRESARENNSAESDSFGPVMAESVVPEPASTEPASAELGSEEFDLTELISAEPGSEELISEEHVPEEPDLTELASEEPDLAELSSDEPDLTELASTELASDESGSPEEIIARFYESHPEINCILLDIPDGIPNATPGETGGSGGFCNAVSAMIGKLGSVIPLSGGRPLVLVPESIDRELIAHRLSKSLNTRPLMSFEAASPENVLSQIHSLM